jgi:hypothetical protein
MYPGKNGVIAETVAERLKQVESQSPSTSFAPAPLQTP